MLFRSAGGLPVAWIQQVAEVAVSGCWPDLTLILDVDDQTATRRMNPLLDRMELKGKEFHKLVRQGFLEEARRFPDRYCILDASQDQKTVEKVVQEAIRKHFFKVIPIQNAN